MKKYLTLLLLVITFQAVAQTYPITGINISLPASPDANTANWGSGTSLFIITANSKAVNGRVDGFVVESKILVTIKKGGAKVCGSYTGNTAPASNFNTLTKVWSGTNAVSLLGQECTLTPGDYEICVQFFGYGAAGVGPLSEEKTKAFSIRAVEQQVYQAPQAIAPADGTVFSESELQKPMIFRWIPVIPRPQEPVTYRLTVWQLMQGQTGMQAMKVNQPIITKDVDNLTQAIINNLTSGPCLPPYMCEFIWNVQALNREGKPIGENDGLSKTSQFSAKRCEVNLVLRLKSVECLSAADGNNIYKICLSATYSSPTFNLTYSISGSGFKAYPSSNSPSYPISLLTPTLQAQNSGSATTVDYCFNVTVPSEQIALKIGLQGDDKDPGPIVCQPGAELDIKLPTCTSCDCGTWTPLTVNRKQYDCGGRIIWKWNQPFNFTTSFQCSPNNESCQAKTTWVIESDGRPIITGTGTNQLNDGFSLPAKGIYNLTLNATCNGIKCKPCNIIILAEDPLPTSVCKNYSVELKKVYKGDSISYQCMITNKYTGDESEYKPKSFRIKIRNSLVIAIVDNKLKEWSRTPSKFPPGSSQIKWTNNSGDIPNGENNLGTICFGVPVANPFYVTYEWLNKEEKTICKDSIALIDTRYYYELEKGPSYTYTEISNDILRIQFINHYASVEDIKLSIYEVGSKKLLKPKTLKNTKLKSINGLNRISIDIKDYNLEPDRYYLLIVSDFNSNYHFNFKVTNDREK